MPADVNLTILLADGLSSASDDDSCYDGLQSTRDGDPADIYNPGLPFGTIGDLYNPGAFPQRDNDGDGAITSDERPAALDPNGNPDQFDTSDPAGNCDVGGTGTCLGGPKDGDVCTADTQCECHGRSLLNGQCDWDNDGHGDLCDTCPTVFNNDQLDTDGDGVGNACENNDLDFGRDGVTKLIPDGRQNGFDNCPTLYNPSQLPFALSRRRDNVRREPHVVRYRRHHRHRRLVQL